MTDLLYKPQIEHEKDLIHEDPTGKLRNVVDRPEPGDADKQAIKDNERMVRDLEIIDNYVEVVDLADQVHDELWNQLKHLDKAIPPVNPNDFPQLHMEMRQLMAGLGMEIPGPNSEIPITRDLLRDAMNVHDAAVRQAGFGTDLPNWAASKMAPHAPGSGSDGVDNPPSKENSEDLSSRADKFKAKILGQLLLIAFLKIVAKICFWAADILKILAWVPGVNDLRNLLIDKGNGLAAQTVEIDVGGLIQPAAEQQRVAPVDRYGRHIGIETNHYRTNLDQTEPYTESEIAARKKKSLKDIQNTNKDYIGGWGTIASNQGGLNVNMIQGAKSLRERVHNWGYSPASQAGEPAPRHGSAAFENARRNRNAVRSSGRVIDICSQPGAIERWKELNPGKEVPREIQDNPFVSIDNQTGQPLSPQEAYASPWLDALRNIDIQSPDWCAVAMDEWNEYLIDMKKNLADLLEIIISWLEDPSTYCCVITHLKGAASVPEQNHMSPVDILRLIRMLAGLLHAESALKFSELSNILNDMVKEIMNAFAMLASIWLRSLFDAGMDKLVTNMDSFIEEADKNCWPASQMFRWFKKVLERSYKLAENIVTEYIEGLGLTFGRLPDYNTALSTRIQAERILWIIDQLIAILSSLEACLQDDPQASSTNVDPGSLLNGVGSTRRTSTITGKNGTTGEGTSLPLEVADGLRQQRLDTLTDIFGTTEEAEREYMDFYGRGISPDGTPAGEAIFGWPSDRPPCTGALSPEAYQAILRSLGVHLNRPES